MEADEKPNRRGKPTIAKEVKASGHWRRCQEAADRRTGETYPPVQSIQQRTWEAQPPVLIGLDRLRLMRREGVGAAIVVGDGERPSQGEGPQGLERSLSVRNPQGSIL